MLEKNDDREVHIGKTEQPRSAVSIAFGLERIGLIAVRAPILSCIVLVALIIAAIAVTPSFLLTSLYFVALRVAFRVGHWPYLGHPDASAMPEDLHPGRDRSLSSCPWLSTRRAPPFFRRWSSDTANARGASPSH